jgi:hypothetical protein
MPASHPNPAGCQPASSTGGAPRAVRGLLLGFILSFLNLLGAFLALMAIGGLGAWTGWQFIGLFGLLEAATGVAFVFGPNVWRLPVAEANTSDRTAIQFAATTVFVPHWAAGAKCIAGLGMMIFAATRAGIGPATIGLPLLIAFLAVAVLALSAIVARFGVARPDLDVLEFVIKRPGKPDMTLPGISIGAITIQLVLNIGAFPAVKLLPPDVFYQPEIGPSPMILGATAVAALVSTVSASLVWRGRVCWRAPLEQQREAEAA